MKKVIALIIFFLLLSPALFASYDEDGRTDEGWLAREGEVISRGLLNILGSVCEIPRTAIREKEIHSRLWPVTFLPRLMTNVIYRGASAFNDVLLYPWVIPFTHDISPWTDHMGIPKYPWDFKN